MRVEDQLHFMVKLTGLVTLRNSPFDNRRWSLFADLSIVVRIHEETWSAASLDYRFIKSKLNNFEGDFLSSKWENEIFIKRESC